MKRAARHKTGSVVFDKRRKTWNLLWWEDGKRRSKLVGTLKAVHVRKGPRNGKRNLSCLMFSGDRWKNQRLIRGEISDGETHWQHVTNRNDCLRVIQRRGCTVPGYETTYCRNGATVLISEAQPRTGGTVVASAQTCRPKANPMCGACCTYSWNLRCGVVRWRFPAIPLTLSWSRRSWKRTRQPRSLTVDEFRRFIQHLEEPFRTMALLCVCFGLRISECLALKWWTWIGSTASCGLNEELSVNRSMT